MTKRTPEGEALTELILETFRLNGAMLDAGNQLTKPMGLTSARWQVMGAIDLAGQPVTVAQIGRRMGLSRQGVQRIVNELVKLGMLELESNLDHKRAPLVAVSRKGQTAIRKINAAQAVWVNDLSEGMSERTITQALKLLRTLRERSDNL